MSQVIIQLICPGNQCLLCSFVNYLISSQQYVKSILFLPVNDLKILKYIANASVILKVTGRTFSIVNMVTDLKFEYGSKLSCSVVLRYGYYISGFSYFIFPIKDLILSPSLWFLSVNSNALRILHSRSSNLPIIILIGI